jgi:hypothetical protein
LRPTFLTIIHLWPSEIALQLILTATLQTESVAAPTNPVVRLKRTPDARHHLKQSKTSIEQTAHVD